VTNRIARIKDCHKQFQKKAKPEKWKKQLGTIFLNR